MYFQRVSGGEKGPFRKPRVFRPSLEVCETQKRLEPVHSKVVSGRGGSLAGDLDALVGVGLRNFREVCEDFLNRMRLLGLRSWLQLWYFGSDLEVVESTAPYKEALAE